MEVQLRRNRLTLRVFPKLPTGRGAQRGCGISDFGSFQDSDVQNAEQPGLIPSLSQLCEEGWTRDLLRSSPAWTGL